VSYASATASASGCHILSGCGFPAPSLNNFEFKPIFTIGSFHFTKPMLLALLCAAIVIWFFWAAFAKPKLVPRGVQNVAELGVMFVRDQILRPAMGKKGDGYLPFLVALFFFIWLMNLMEIIPVAMFPVSSRIGYVWGLVGVVWVTFMFIGMKQQGPLRFFATLVPPGVPWWIIWFLAPVVILSDVVVQTFTLGVRLFANMFAGTLLIGVFIAASWYLASLNVYVIFAAGSFFMVLVLTAFEVLIQFLQAFIFTTLTATYIARSLDPQH
jgi:F-type H+-transporting ATPase subunit a